MSVIAMMFLIFVFTRFMRFGRVHGMRRGHCGDQFAWHPRRQSRGLRHEKLVAEPEAPKLSAFDALKDRYVRGAISEAQYESELDQLLQTPEGRSQML